MLEWIKNIFARRIYFIEGKILKPVKKGEVAIITIPGANARDIARIIEVFEMAKKRVNGIDTVYTMDNVEVRIINKVVVRGKL